MAKQQVEDVKPEVEVKQPVQTEAQLMALLTKVLEDRSADEKFEKLVGAILESRKPYKDPLQEQNMETARQREREQNRRNKEAVKQNQSVCPHVKGSLGDKPSLNESSFILHRLDTGVVIGICTACQKMICSLKPEDAPLFRQARSGNRMSGGGVRSFADPNKAQRDGWPNYDE